MKKILLSLIFVFGCLFCYSQDKTIYLWRNVKGMEKQPSVMYMHEPKVNKTKTAVIVCPGGSYHHLGLYNEGYCSAKWFSENGITAFMLKYRSNESLYNHPAMLEDIQRAIQIVRENADDFGIDASKVGVIGYSAGGHLVTMAGEFGERFNELEKLGIETVVSLRPDFVMPIYPVVSMQDDISHKWSRRSLLGKNQTQERKDLFSMELQVPDNMPPTYIVVCKDDNVVDYNNSLRLYDALLAKNIQNCELHVYEWGKHGFGMLNGPFMKEFKWNEPLLEWIKKIGMYD